MTNPTRACAVEDLPESDQQRLATILDDYLAAIEQGSPISPDELLERHPEQAGYLRDYLSGLQLFHRAAKVEQFDSTLFGQVDTGGEQILGDYRLIREVGRGGMGVVYEAEQLSLKRRVALKVLPFVVASDEKRLLRFQTESKIAASIDHPNIVPVHAMGEQQGVHYYAMQFIEGPSLGDWIGQIRDSAETVCVGQRSTRPPTCSEPLTESCQQQTSPSATDVATSVSSLSNSQLKKHLQSVVQIGIQAADALHSAHEYGVVHRDVKPSNLLIDESGKLWITDFGLARCRDGSDLTQTGDVLGTFKYMSPEQAGEQGFVIDHRTDVYSLGVTLYEAAVLRNPMAPDQAGLLTSPRRPAKRLRQWDRRIPADLETIVMKAIATAPEERYQSMASLAEDLRRFHAEEPILARPPGVARRVQNWAKRNQQAVISAVCALVVAVTALSVALVIAAREQHKTEQHLAYSNEQLSKMREILDSSSQWAEQLAAIPGAERVRRQLLDETLMYYKQVAAETSDNPDLQADVALAYAKLGEHTARIGDKLEALAYHQRSSEILHELLAERPNEAPLRQRLAVNLNNMGALQKDLGRLEEAKKSISTAEQMQKRLASWNPADETTLKAETAATSSNLGLIALEQGQAQIAKRQLSRAIQLLEEATASNSDQDHLRQLAIAYGNYASFCEVSNPAEAQYYYGKATLLQKQLVAEQPLNLVYQRDLARTYNNLGRLAATHRDWTEATENYRSAMTIQKRLVEVSPAVLGYLRDLAASQNNLGMVFARQGRLQQAKALFAESAATQTNLLEHNASDVQALMSFGGLVNNRGILLQRQGDHQAALSAFRKAVDYQARAHDLAPESDAVRQLLSNHLYNLAECCSRLGRTEESADATARRDELMQTEATNERFPSTES